MRVRAVILLVLAASTPVAAQSPQTPTFRAGVELLEVDVSVVDDRGRPVADLRSPEFTVTVDGETRKVVSTDFVWQSASPPDESKVAVPQDLYVSSNAGRQTGRLIVLVVDQANIKPGEGKPMMAAAGRFLDKLNPTDRVGLAVIPAPGATVDFTVNRDLIRAALNRVTGTPDPLPGNYNIGISEAIAVASGDPFAEGTLMERVCGDLRASMQATCVREVEVEAMQIAHEVRQKADSSVRALLRLLQNLKDVEGPKSLVLMSQGLILEGNAADASILASIAAQSRVTINVLLLETNTWDVSVAERPPTGRADRDLQVSGLEALALRSRGSLFRVYGSADYAFDRVSLELSGYYLLGVEPLPRDRDGKTHQIRVEVGRRGTTVRARREFRFTEPVPAGKNDQDLMARMLRSPMLATDLPVRVATYAYQDPGTSKVRVIVATEIDRAEAGPANMSIGFAVFDPEGRVVVSGEERKTLEPARGKPLGYTLAILVDPGTYTLKFAAMDESGRRGSVERPLTAWQMSGLPLAVGDLMLADVSAGSTGTPQPQVDFRIGSGQLGAYMELYGDLADALDDAKVSIEIASDESSPTLTTGTASVESRGDPRRREVWGVLPVGMLPPGRYVARAIVSSSGQIVGKLARPFQVLPGTSPVLPGPSPARATAVAAVAVAPLVAPNIGRFQREEVLKPDMLQAVFAAMDKARPAAKAAVARARTGKLEGTGLQALEAGDQVAAAFLRGLELFTSGQLDPAGIQFAVAMRAAPDFPLAAFYLGACYAAVGKDQEALLTWEKLPAGQEQIPLWLRLRGLAWLRLGQAAKAIAPLHDALSKQPNDDDVRRNLAIAYLSTRQHGEAYATVEPYLPSHPADHEALLVAIQSIYEMHAAGRSMTTPEHDREEMSRYSRAYAAANGPNQPLVATWVEFVDKDQR